MHTLTAAKNLKRKTGGKLNAARNRVKSGSEDGSDEGEENEDEDEDKMPYEVKPKKPKVRTNIQPYANCDLTVNIDHTYGPNNRAGSTQEGP